VWAESRQIVVLMCSTLSMLGCSLIFISYSAWKDVRCTSRKLLVYLSVCDFVVAASNSVGILTPTDEVRERIARVRSRRRLLCCLAQPCLISPLTLVARGL
jgi:hypothetical protein